MSADVYLHGVQGDWPVVHEHIGGNGVRDNVNLLLREEDERAVSYTQRHPDSGWALIEASQFFLLQLMEQLEREDLAEKIRKSPNIHWIIWMEF